MNSENQEYKYIVYEEDYRLTKIIYVTKNFEDIKTLLKENKLSFLDKSTYKKIIIDKMYIEKANSKYTNSNNDSKEKYLIDTKNKSILDYKNKTVIYSYSDEKIDNYIQKKNKLTVLIKEANDLYFSKNIPNELNNYFHIVYAIENSNDNTKIDEDLDYMDVIIKEMNTYPNKEKN